MTVVISSFSDVVLTENCLIRFQSENVVFKFLRHIVDRVSDNKRYFCCHGIVRVTNFVGSKKSCLSSLGICLRSSCVSPWVSCVHGGNFKMVYDFYGAANTVIFIFIHFSFIQNTFIFCAEIRTNSNH